MHRPELKLTSSKITFHNTRARFQRLQDAKLFNGWVNSLTPKGVIVALKEPIESSIGERFRFEVFGTGTRAVFDARLEIMSGTLAAFVLTTSLKTLPSNEDMRLRAKDMHATIFLAGNPNAKVGIPDLDEIVSKTSENPFAEGQVLDVSNHGLGLITDKALRKGERIRVVIDTPWGDAEAMAEVRYCKSEGDRKRLGLCFTSMDRLNRGLYERLLKQTAAA